MLAARLHGNSDLRVEEVAEPDAVGPGQVRVRPQWCGICGTDLHEYAHGPLFTPPENLPQVIGHVFCGTCYYCLRGRQGLCDQVKILVSASQGA